MILLIESFNSNVVVMAEIFLVNKKDLLKTSLQYIKEFYLVKEIDSITFFFKHKIIF